MSKHSRISRDAFASALHEANNELLYGRYARNGPVTYACLVVRLTDMDEEVMWTVGSYLSQSPQERGYPSLRATTTTRPGNLMFTVTSDMWQDLKKYRAISLVRKIKAPDAPYAAYFVDEEVDENHKEEQEEQGSQNGDSDEDDYLDVVDILVEEDDHIDVNGKGKMKMAGIPLRPRGRTSHRS